MNQSPKNEDKPIFPTKGALALLFFFAVFGFLFAGQTGNLASIRSFLLAQVGQPFNLQNTEPAYGLPPRPLRAAINASNQILAEFTINNNTGSPIVVNPSKASFLVTGTGGTVTDIDNVFLYSSTTISAGPLDVPVGGTITLADTFVIPTGESSYTIRGKLSTNFVNDQTVQVLINPSKWVATSQTTGQPITLPNSPVFLSAATARGAAAIVGVSSSPSSTHTIVAGQIGATLASIQIDTGASGERVRFDSLPLYFRPDVGNSYPVNCRIYDPYTQRNLNSSAVNPTSYGVKIFTLDTPFITLPTSMQYIELRCDIPTNVVNGHTMKWGLATSTPIIATGNESGTSFTASYATGIWGGVGEQYIISTGGALSVSLDSSSPGYGVKVAGTTNNDTTVLRLHATTESILFNQIGLQLSGTSASSSPSDIVQATIWSSGLAKLGTVIFTGSNRYATTTLTNALLIPKDGDATLTIKTDLSNIGLSQPGTEGAFIKIDYDGDNATATRGTGGTSGSTIVSASHADTTSAGFRMFHSIPTLSVDPLASTGLNDGKFLRFKVTADSHGNVILGKLTLRVTTASTTLPTGPVLYGYTDSAYSMPISGVGAVGIIADNTMYEALNNTSTTFSFYPKTSTGATTTVVVPAGQTRYFEFRGKVSVKKGGGSVTAQLLGDSAYPALSNTMLIGVMGPWQIGVDSPKNASIRNFIWSGYSTSTTPLTTDQAWSNGYGLIGLPPTGLFQTRTGTPPKGK